MLHGKGHVMTHSIEEYTFHRTRRALLTQRVEHIRQTMLGDNLDVRELLAGEDGGPSSARTAELASRLADTVDDLQKAYWVFDDLTHDEETEQLMGIDPAWQEVLGQHRSFDETVALDLSALPTTLQPARRETLEDLFYCVLMSCSCEALGRTSIGAVRRLLSGTAQLTPGWREDGKPERLGLTSDGLVLRELESEVEIGPLMRYWLEAEDVFGLMDTLYEIVSGKPATALVPSDDLERVRLSPAGREVLQRAHLRDDLEKTWGTSTLRLLTSLDVEGWESLDREERQRTLLASLPDSSDEELASLEADWEISELLSMTLGWDALASWRSWDAAQRRDALASALESVAEEGWREGSVIPGETSLDEIDAWFEEQVRELHDGVRAWAERMGDTDELFSRYRSLREGFFSAGMPQGAFPGYSAQVGRWFAEGFGELASAALDTVLGEEGLSWTFDDEVFHRTYAYLGEAGYQMELAIDHKGGHRG